MLKTSVAELEKFIQAIKTNPEAIYKRTISAAVLGIQDEDGQIRGLAMELFAELFKRGYAFQEAAELIRAGKIKETFDHKRLETGLIQLFHQYGKEHMLESR